MSRFFVGAAIAAGFAAMLASGSAVAQQAPAPAAADPVLLQRLLRDLKCQPGQQCDAGPRTRSIAGAPPPVDLKNEGTRRSIEARARSGALPSADVEVYFPYNSVELVPDTIRKLDTMAAALRNDGLSSSQFAIIGHTDAKGTDGYNQALSLQRAEAVRQYLETRGGVAGSRLEAWGRGKQELKRPDDPTAAENRRVQLVNAGRATAQRQEPAAAAEPAQSSSTSTSTPSATAAPKSTGCRMYSPTANMMIDC